MKGKFVLVLTSLLGALSAPGAGNAGGDRNPGSPGSEGADASEGDLWGFFAAADRNDDGFLTLEEVADEIGMTRTCLPAHLISKEARERLTEEARQSIRPDFEAADRNHDGRLSISEVRRALHEAAALDRGR